MVKGSRNVICLICFYFDLFFFLLVAHSSLPLLAVFFFLERECCCALSLLTVASNACPLSLAVFLCSLAYWEYKRESQKALGRIVFSVCFLCVCVCLCM